MIEHHYDANDDSSIKVYHTLRPEVILELIQNTYGKLRAIAKRQYGGYLGNNIILFSSGHKVLEIKL